MNLLGQVRCDLKPNSMAKAPTPGRPTADPSLFRPRTLTKELHAVCAQQTARTPATDLPFWQKHLFGSAEWWASWNRRNRVEGLFGNLKNDASQNITRGRIRVMGLAKVSLMCLFVAMATNLRLTDTFAAEQARQAAEQAAAAAGVTKQTRKLRWRTQLRHEMRERIAARQDARAVHDDATEAAAAAQDATRRRPPARLVLLDPPPDDGS